MIWIQLNPRMLLSVTLRIAAVLLRLFKGNSRNGPRSTSFKVSLAYSRFSRYLLGPVWGLKHISDFFTQLGDRNPKSMLSS